jgi:hypothetical protein
MSILWGIVIFWTGIIVGVMLWAWLMNQFRKYSGTLVVSKDELRDTTVYSLVLDEYPEKLAFEKVVIFRVDSSEAKSNRE